MHFQEAESKNGRIIQCLDGRVFNPPHSIYIGDYEGLRQSSPYFLITKDEIKLKNFIPRYIPITVKQYPDIIQWIQNEPGQKNLAEGLKALTPILEWNEAHHHLTYIFPDGYFHGGQITMFKDNRQFRAQLHKRLPQGRFEISTDGRTFSPMKPEEFNEMMEAAKALKDAPVAKLKNGAVIGIRKNREIKKHWKPDLFIKFFSKSVKITKSTIAGEIRKGKRTEKIRE